MSLILLAKIRDFKRLRRYRLRKTTAPIRIKINNLVSQLPEFWVKAPSERGRL